MAAAPRHLSSLRAALKLAMKGPGDHRTVIVDGVHLTQAAALLAFLEFERSSGRWSLPNAARLSSLVSLDGLLRALATDLLPRLVTDPAPAPALNLLSRYARYIMASASAAGGTFARDATDVCKYIVKCADDATTRRPLLLRRRAEEMLRRIRDLRSRQVTITALPDPVPVPVPEDPDSDAEDDDLHLTTLRQALQEATDAPAADRCVYVDAVRASHSFGLLAVVEFQATACSWRARNLGRIRAATTVAGCCETLAVGLLRVLLDDPTRRAALAIAEDFAEYMMGKIGRVGGEFAEHAARICLSLTAHGASAKRRPLLVPSLVMKSRAEKIRQQLAAFTSRTLSVAVDSGSDTISTEISDTDSDTGTTVSSRD